MSSTINHTWPSGPLWKWVTMRFQFHKRLLPNGEKPGRWSATLSKDMATADVELLEHEDAFLYQRVYKEGKDLAIELVRLQHQRTMALAFNTGVKEEDLQAVLKERGGTGN